MIKDSFLIKYIVSLFVFLGIDAVWLGIIAKDLYKNSIGHLMSDKPNFIAAGVFYLLFPLAVVVFALIPALREESVTKAALLGGFLGFITYATYDLTNLATLRDWPLNVTIIDLIWGTFLTATVTTISYLILK